MRQTDRMSICKAAEEERAAALEDLAEATDRVAVQLHRGEQPSNAALAREEAALLRLQNARALLVLNV